MKTKSILFASCVAAITLSASVPWPEAMVAGAEVAAEVVEGAGLVVEVLEGAASAVVRDSVE